MTDETVRLFPIYNDMTLTDLRTKQCPFCAETIQARAVKCRFCGEFLNSQRAKSLQAGAESDSEPLADGKSDDSDALFACRPSLLGLAPQILKGLLLIAIAALLVKLPLEKVLDSVPGVTLTKAQVALFAQYRIMIGLGLGLAVVFWLVIKAARLRTTRYQVTAQRIEWARGIFDRKVDNIDMFRVVDLKLRRSFFDWVLGIGIVVLTTTDKSDPEFVFERVRNCRRLYDVIKRASLEADRGTRVVHLE
jgi:membrane protein YdbS with pleckstrin-like domain